LRIEHDYDCYQFCSLTARFCTTNLIQCFNCYLVMGILRVFSHSFPVDFQLIYIVYLPNWNINFQLQIMPSFMWFKRLILNPVLPISNRQIGRPVLTIFHFWKNPGFRLTIVIGTGKCSSIIYPILILFKLCFYFSKYGFLSFDLRSSEHIIFLLDENVVFIALWFVNVIA